jgi:tyrosine-protein kinase Etk/Wzc
MSEQVIIDRPNAGTAKANDEVHLLDLMVILARHKRLVVGMPVLFGIAGVVATLLMTPIFASTAKVLPPQQQQNSGLSMMLGQLGGLAGAAGGLAGLKSPNDLYVGLLESRRMSDRLIQRFKLTERYGTTMEGARRALADNSEISSGKKDGMLAITVSDRDPQVAANIANAYVDELTRLTQTMALTEASQRRMFFEKQLAQVKDQLANAEIAMRTTQEKTGMIQPEAQVQAIIGNAAQLKGIIAAKEVELNAMRTFAAGQNPELLRTQEELRGLRAQLAKLEKSQSATDRGFMVPTGKLPEVGVEYVRRMRDVKYYETIFELLAKQFELAKIDEAKDASMIQVLDKAIPAEQRYKPKRSLIVLALAFAGLVVGMLLAFMKHGYDSSRQNPASRQRWEQLSAALRRDPKGRPSSR